MFPRHLEDRQVTSLTREADCDEEKTDLVDSIPRCYQSNQCGGQESSYIRSIGGGRTFASMETEEDDLPHRERISSSSDKTWTRVFTLDGEFPE